MRTRLRCYDLECRAVPSANYILTNEHADVQVNYAAGTWDMFTADEDAGQDYPAGESLGYVHPTHSLAVRPPGPAFDFVGVPAGTNFYRLPQNQNPLLLYMGFGAEEVTPGTFTSYDPWAESRGRVSTPAAWVRLQLTAVTGPGSFFVWRDEAGAPVRFFSTFNDGVVNPEPDGIDYTDGVGPDDALWVPEAGHIDYNVGFTAVGRYEVSLRPTALVGGAPTTGPVFTFVFSVGNVGQVGFAMTGYTVNEAAGTATVTLSRTGGSDGAVAVDYATGGGTATPNADYTESKGTVTFFDQETSKTFTVPVTNDSDPESAETVGLTLSNFRPWLKPGGEPSDPPIQGTPTSATLTITDDDSGTPPPRVSAVTVNGGAAQRSRVTAVAVTFDQPVTFSGAPAAAFQMKRQSDGGIAGVAAAVDNSGPGTVVTLTFTGSLTQGGSLNDGRYTLTVFAGGVVNLDGNGDGTPGDNYVLVGDTTNKLFRLFGDADGDGDVDAVDFGGFRTAFGGTANLAFDADGDGDVDAVDFGQFRVRFGSALP